MLEMYMVRGALCYGGYSETLVAATSSEEAKEIVLAEAKDYDLYESYRRFPEDIEVTYWGPFEKGIILATGHDV